MRRKDENKQQRIFDAAISLIHEVGFSDTSMSKIAKRAEVSPATIYVYFENKSDMLNKLYLTVKRGLLQSVFSGIESCDTLEHTLKKAMRIFIRYAQNNKEKFLFIEQFENSPLIQSFTKQECQNMFARLFELIERGKREGLLKQMNVDLLYVYACCPLIEMIKESFKGNFELNEENIQMLADMSYNAIKA